MDGKLTLSKADLAVLIKEQAVALVEEMSKNNKIKRRYAAESDEESDEESGDEDGDTNKNKSGKDDSDEDSDSDSDGSPYAWIGKWIQKPKGERCRRSKGRRTGFTTERLLKRAKITKEQYGMYKKTAHQLIGRHFDIAKNFRTNMDNHPDSWALIIEKMKERHPRFRWHAKNWVVVHITVTHLEATRRSLKKRDPDLKVLQEYEELNGKGTVKKRKIRPELESESMSERPGASTRPAPMRKQTTSQQRQVQVLPDTVISSNDESSQPSKKKAPAQKRQRPATQQDDLDNSGDDEPAPKKQKRTKSPAVSVRDEQPDPPLSSARPSRPSRPTRSRSRDKAPFPSAPPSMARPVGLTSAPASPTRRSGRLTRPAASALPRDKAPVLSTSPSLARPVGLTSASASPTRRSGRLTRPAAPALPARFTPTDLSPSPLSEEDDFDYLFRRATQRGNGKADPKGKGKADPKGKGKADPNNPVQRPKRVIRGIQNSRNQV